MEKKKKFSFPKNFFTKERPEISNKEALKDVIPINWKEETNKNKKTDSTSIKERKAL